MRRVLHHIVLVQRAYRAILEDRPFDWEKEAPAPATFDELDALFRATHAEAIAAVGALEESELARTVEMRLIPGLRFSMAEGLMQVVMHSQSHRGQCATRLRILGGKAPMTDFILWVKERAKPE
jgi:uncharacterized damage-inducible protein DinB